MLEEKDKNLIKLSRYADKMGIKKRELLALSFFYPIMSTPSTTENILLCITDFYNTVDERMPILSIALARL